MAALAVVAAVAWPHCSAVGAEGQWQRHTIDDSSRGADGARLADVNGDGLMDIAVPWEEGGVVRVYLHPGHDRARERWPAVTVGTVGSPEDAVLADLDRDGAADVVSSCEGKTRAIHIHWAPREPGRYLEPEAWRTEAIPAVRGLAQWMVALPLEIDGRDGLDMVVGARGEGAAVGWLQAPPDARDVAAWKYHPLRASGWIMSLEAADMDADGDLDVLLSDRKGRGRGVFWLENPGPEAAGRGAAWREHEVARGLGEVMFLTTADLLPGGQREIVAAVRGGPLALLLPAGDEAGTWERLEIAMLDSAGTGKAVAAGDLDGDARCDLALTCEGAGGGKSGVWWLSRSRGKNTFYFRQHDVSGRAGTKFDRVELLDLDGDGDLDILTCEETENLGVVWYENPLPPPVAPQDRPATTLALFLAAGATASAPADFVLAPLTFVIVFYSMPLWRQVLDEPPPRVEDLTGYRRPVPDADNGFAAAAVPDDLLSWPEDDEPVQGVSLTFDRREAAALLARHAEALRRLEASLASPEFQAPEAVSHMDLVDYFLSWRELCYLASCRARLLFEEGEEDEAFAVALDLARFGHRIEGCQGSMIHYLVGRAVKSIAIQTLVEFLPRTTLAPAELRPFLDALGDYPANRQGIRDALCAEFVIRTSALEAMAAGRLDSLRENDVEGELMEAPARDGHKHPGHGLERAGEELLEVVALATPILLPQASRRLLAEQVRRFIRDVGRPLPERERMDPGARHDVVPDESLTVNAGGRSVLLLALEDFQRFVTDADVEDARVRGVQVLIALRSFQIETGRLPRLLDELVPRHLTAVPLDPFDGKPLRYSAEKRIVYSVGRDLTDDGGSEEQDPASASDDEDEPTFRIDF